jgi:hypothetical protein
LSSNFSSRWGDKQDGGKIKRTVPILFGMVIDIEEQEAMGIASARFTEIRG